MLPFGGKGVVAGFMDRGTIYPPVWYRKTLKLASDHGIMCQTKTTVAGGKNTIPARFIGANGGILTMALSVPGPLSAFAERGRLPKRY